jgi:two-component system, OmpR family, response regulator ResD
MTRILIVEDEPNMVAGLRDNFEFEGYDVITAQDGVAGLQRALDDSPDLVLLDVMMPRMSGLDVCKQLKTKRPSIPVIMLTARGQEVDKVVGLELGADDYVTKPFSPRELVLRVESVLRRSQATHAEPSKLLTLGPLSIDTTARRATKNGTELYLTARELDLLAYLMARPGTAYTRTELMAAVWGRTFGDQSTVTVHVRRLREKIEDDPQNPRLIQTVWGVGYRMEAP